MMSSLKLINDSAPWAELDKFVTNLRRIVSPERQIWIKFNEKPLDCEAINELINNGCAIEFISGKGAYTWLGDNQICLGRDHSGYERDKTLFHELVHAYYGKDTVDLVLGCWDLTIEERVNRCQNNAIVEWKARQLRASPELLRYTIDSFKLKRYAYDRVSLEAFSDFDLDRQLSFEFSNQYFEDMKCKVMMD